DMDPIAQPRLRIGNLLGQHVDEELVWRIRRQARAPVTQQVATHDGQKEKRREAKRERADGKARRERTPAQVREPEAPRDTAGRHAPQEREQKKREKT